MSEPKHNIWILIYIIYSNKMSLILIVYSFLAPYHSVSKQIERTAEGDKVVLTCQSEGYPQSPVVWQDGHLQSYSSNTTTTTTPDGLIKVVSQIEVSSSEKTKYTCNFTKDHSSATFHIPGKFLTFVKFFFFNIVLKELALQRY